MHAPHAPVSGALAVDPIGSSILFRRARAALCAWLALTTIVGCSNNFAANPADSGTGGSSAEPLPPCKPDAPSCDPRAPGCSLGRCVSVDCATLEHQDNARGCVFYGYRANNVDTDINQPTMLALSSASDFPADVAVEVRTVDGTWSAIANTQVPPRGGQRLSLTAPAALGEAGPSPRAGFRITSTHPVMVVQITSDDLSHGSQSTGGTVLRPVQSLGFRHLAMTYPQLATVNVSATAGSRAGAGTFVAIATRDGTALTLTAAVDTLVTPGASGFAPANETQTFQLSEGDAVQLLTLNDGDDLTGTLVVSSSPIAAFSGNVYSTYGAEVTGFNGGDLTIEQLPPIESWGSEYVGAWLSPQDNCDPFFGAATGLWTVLAADDTAAITILPAAGVTLTVADQFTLAAGTAQTFRVIGRAPTPGDPGVAGDFFITGGTSRILLAQWLECEPSLSWGIDTRHGPSDLNVVLPPNFDHEMVVVRERKSPVIFDGSVNLEPRFQSSVNGGRYEIARITKEDLGSCTDLLDSCTHVIGDGAFGVSWRGMDVVCSYAVTVPSRGSVCALPNADCAF